MIYEEFEETYSQLLKQISLEPNNSMLTLRLEDFLKNLKVHFEKEYITFNVSSYIANEIWEFALKITPEFSLQKFENNYKEVAWLIYLTVSDPPF